MSQEPDNSRIGGSARPRLLKEPKGGSLLRTLCGKMPGCLSSQHGPHDCIWPFDMVSETFAFHELTPLS